LLKSIFSKKKRGEWSLLEETNWHCIPRIYVFMTKETMKKI